MSFVPAKRENVGLLIGLAGASGSGKTYSALKLAYGIASSSDKIAFIDTEARRGLHYADLFNPPFLYTELSPPFRPDRFVQKIHEAEKAGAEVVIIDSFSHEYDGDGGIMDWADELQSSGIKSPGNWKQPKLAHKKLMNALLQIRATVIFCLRADEKIEIVPASDGRKTSIRPLGWVPICEKRFMYEMTVSFTLDPSDPGVPKFNLPHKLQQQHRDFFPQRKHIGDEAGKMLALWAAGGSPRQRQQQQPDNSPSTPAEDQSALFDLGKSAAVLGTQRYMEWYLKLSQQEKEILLQSQQHQTNYKSAQIVDQQEGIQPYKKPTGNAHD